MKHSLILVAALAICLQGCTHSFERSLAGSDVQGAVPNKWISGAILRENRSEFEAKIIAYLSERYPRIPSNLSGIELGTVTISNEFHERAREDRDATEHALRELFTNVVGSTLGKREHNVTLDVSVTFMTPGDSAAGEAAFAVAAVPMMALCWGSAFVVCPGGGTSYVVLDATIVGASPPIRLRGIGGATRVVSTMLIEDSNDAKVTGQLEENTKAMAAAVADLSAKLIPHLQAK